MRNKLLITALALFLIPLSASAQDEWEEVEAPYALNFEGRVHSGGIVHGVVVDDDGKIWINNYGGAPEGQEPGFYVYNSDGTPASFSPITSVTVDGTEYPTTSLGRGITKGPDGDIFVVYNDTQLFKIDAETGEGLGLWEGPKSLTRPGVDQDGFVYVAGVAGSEPIHVIDSQTWTETLTIDDGSDWTWWSRAVEVTPDGQTVFSGRLGGGLVVLESEDLVNYTLTDTVWVFDGDASSVQLDPEGMLWATDDGQFPDDPGFTTRSIKVFDPENKTYYTLTHDSLDVRLRGIGFIFDGDTKEIVVGSFGTGYTERYSLVDPGTVAIEDPETPQRFTLRQNYPNPFNPTTTIEYTLREAGEVDLRVYNATGQLVKTLASGFQAAGVHYASWNGTDANGSTVSSGLYFYSLHTDGHRETRAMTFLK